MKAAVIDRFGGLEELHLSDIPKPKPSQDEVLIRVHGAGVGIWDSLQRRGELAPDKPEFPMVLGAECSGEIEALGSEVRSLKAGDRVYTYFYGRQGAYAEYVAVKADAVSRKPDLLSFVEAAGVPTDAITAHQALIDGLRLQEGEWVYIAGGAGGVGSLAVQMAVNLGAKVITSARNEHFSMLESFGVARENVIDYTMSDVVKAVRDLSGGGVDAALDAVGGESAKQTIATVKDGGRMAELTGQDLPERANVEVTHVESKPSAARHDPHDVRQRQIENQDWQGVHALAGARSASRRGAIAPRREDRPEDRLGEQVDADVVVAQAAREAR